MKSLVALSLAFAFVAITECFVELPFSKADLESFKNLKFEQLPRELKVSLRRSIHSEGLSNWCCVNNKPIKSIQKTKVVSVKLKVKTTVVSGYAECDRFGTLCPTYDVQYKMQPEYHTTYYEVPDPTKCSKTDIRCCDGYITFAGECFALSELAKYTSQLLNGTEKGSVEPVG